MLESQQPLLQQRKKHFLHTSSFCSIATFVLFCFLLLRLRPTSLETSIDGQKPSSPKKRNAKSITFPALMENNPSPGGASSSEAGQEEPHFTGTILPPFTEIAPPLEEDSGSDVHPSPKTRSLSPEFQHFEKSDFPKPSPVLISESAPADFTPMQVMPSSQLVQDRSAAAEIDSEFFNPLNPSKCSDPRDGYEVRVASCSTIRERPVYLTRTDKFYVPWVLDQNAKCRKKECAISDKYTCCRPRRKCFPNYLTDVGEGCPSTEVLNPYRYAFCRTSPCTIADFDICCVHESALYQRVEITRSRYGRTSPSNSSPFSIPRISFGYHSIVWIDPDTKKTVDGEEWVALVNFMASWRSEDGWTTAPWIKLAKKGKQKYKQLAIKQMTPGA